MLSGNYSYLQAFATKIFDFREIQNRPYFFMSKCKVAEVKMVEHHIDLSKQTLATSIPAMHYINVMCVCVCVSVYMCMHVCVTCACVCHCVCVCAHPHVCAYM